MGRQVGVGAARLRAAGVARLRAEGRCPKRRAPEPPAADRAARPPVGSSGRRRGQPAARRSRRAGVRGALLARDPPRPASAAARSAHRPGQPQRDVLGLGALLSRARRGDPACATSGTRPRRPGRQPWRPRAPARPPPLPGQLRRAVSPVRQLLPPRRVFTSAGSRASSGSPASSAACSPARAPDPPRDLLRERRGEPRVEPRRRGIPARAGPRRRLPSSATGTTGSRGATTSTRGSPS